MTGELSIIGDRHVKPRKILSIGKMRPSDKRANKRTSFLVRQAGRLYASDYEHELAGPFKVYLTIRSKAGNYIPPCEWG